MGLCLGKQLPPSLWSDLPPDLASLVLCRLPSHADRLCRQWCLTAKQQYPLLPPVIPWLCLNFDNFFRGFQSLPDGHLSRSCMYLEFSVPVCVSDGWLLYLRSTPPDRLFLSKATMNLMIVCSGDLVAAIFYDGDVCFYRVGDPSWLVCTNDRREGQYEDIAFHHDKLFALTTKEELFAFDAGDSEASNVEHVIRAAVESPPATNKERLPCIKRYLVTSCGKLLMVKLTDHDRSRIIKNIGVKVFEAELGTGQWVEVKKLDGGQALFVGRGCSKAILLSGHERGFQGNRVYFLAIEFFYWFFGFNRADAPNYCFYDMGDGCRYKQCSFLEPGRRRH
ncbi:unnamed protein product [Urochloa decumbens]|uniref:KIB1-4 beta-propeller domain-containing protein n=1 Tax=Urochloa decumbens TaxID=240449 RepID=A0ABC9E8P3_9POAL